MEARMLSLDAPGLARTLEAMAPEDLDAQPFGIVRLDADQRVTFYSARERSLSGYRGTALGQRFFSDVAPCMNNAEFAGRIARATGAGTLDATFDYVSDLPSGERDVELRVRLVSAFGGGTWILIARDDED